MSEHSPEKCFAEKAPEEGPPLIVNGNVSFQAHHVGWIVCGFFTIVATIASFWLINKHLQWYTNKRQQRYIVRLLFMVPIYATISLASYLFWNHATPLILLRDGYESIVLTGFFYLLLNYISTDSDEQRLAFLKHGISKQADLEAVKGGKKPTRWMFPLGFVKAKPADGLYFLQLMKWGVLQYCVIRPLTTLVSIVLDYSGLYCEASWSPGWGHIYIVVIVSISVTIAMYCLIQLYMPISPQLAPHKPLLKLFAIKAVVFLTFWQASFLSVLSMFGVVKDSKYMTAEQINIGFGALLETFEMMFFAFLHIKAFTYKPYRTQASLSSDDPPQRTPRWKSLGHAMNFGETFREISQGWLYMCDRIRHKESRYDKSVRRTMHLEGALGVVRNTPQAPASGDVMHTEKDLAHTELDRAERQWLGIGDNFDYSLTPIAREKSGNFEEEIEQELQRRGLQPDHVRGIEKATANAHPRQRSWWRSLYDRISQSGPEENIAHRSPSQHPRRNGIRHRRGDTDNIAYGPLTGQRDDYLDELPPPSVLRRFQQSKIRQPGSSSDEFATLFNGSLPSHGARPSHSQTPHSPRQYQDSMVNRLFPHSSTNLHSSPDFSVSPDESVTQESSVGLQFREPPRRQTAIVELERQGISRSAIDLVSNYIPSPSTEFGVRAPPPSAQQNSRHYTTTVVAPTEIPSTSWVGSYPDPASPTRSQGRYNEVTGPGTSAHEDMYRKDHRRSSLGHRRDGASTIREASRNREPRARASPHRVSIRTQDRAYMNTHLVSPVMPERLEGSSRYPQLPSVSTRSSLPSRADQPYPISPTEYYDPYHERR